MCIAIPPTQPKKSNRRSSQHQCPQEALSLHSLQNEPPIAKAIPYAPIKDNRKHTKTCFIEFLSMCAIR